MNRRFILLVFLGIAAAAFWLLGQRPDSITFENGTATRMGDSPMFMIGLTIKNGGIPDRLVSVTSPEAEMVNVMHPEGSNDLVIPGQGDGILARDGAHIMLRSKDPAPEDGALIPITLVFEDAGEVATQVRAKSVTSMDHSLTNGVDASPAPTLVADWTTPPSTDGFAIELTVDNFTFVRLEETAAHIDGQGHAHVYLNGLKLGRLYDRVFSSGPLLPGKYILSVALNTNDHRPYVSNGSPVAVTLPFEVLK